MMQRRSKLTIIVILGFVLLLTLACKEPDLYGDSEERSSVKREWEYLLTDDSRKQTQTGPLDPQIQELPILVKTHQPLVYPIRFKGLGTHTRECRQTAEIIFNAYGDMSCNVQVSWPGACAGPLAETMGLSISFAGTITEQDEGILTEDGRHPNVCELNACNTGNAFGEVSFFQDEMIGTSTLNCLGNNSIVEFDPLEKVNLEPVP